MTCQTDGDYVLKNTHRTAVLSHIVCKICETPKARTILEDRHQHASLAAASATNILLAFGARFSDPGLIADLKAERTAAIDASSWALQLFGLPRLKTQIWRSILASLREGATVLDLEIEPGAATLTAHTPILSFAAAARALGPLAHLPVASIESALALTKEPATPELSVERSRLLAALGAAAEASGALQPLYETLPAIAEAIEAARNYRDLIAVYPRAAEITDLQPRPNATALPATAASVLASL